MQVRTLIVCVVIACLALVGNTIAQEGTWTPPHIVQVSYDGNACTMGGLPEPQLSDDGLTAVFHFDAFTASQGMEFSMGGQSICDLLVQVRVPDGGATGVLNLEHRGSLRLEEGLTGVHQTIWEDGTPVQEQRWPGPIDEAYTLNESKTYELEGGQHTFRFHVAIARSRTYKELWVSRLLNQSLVRLGAAPLRTPPGLPPSDTAAMISQPHAGRRTEHH